MDNRSKLALYPAYYLARFNELAYQRLGYGNQRQTHEAISNIIGVKQTTFKQMRDGYDPLFENRAGYYQRPMSPSRAIVADAMEDLGENDVHAIVMEILGKRRAEEDSLTILLEVPASAEKSEKSREYFPRGVTGRKAEEYFIKWFPDNQKPATGKLVDTREFGTGYDFEIVSENEKVYVEVKGLAAKEGGIGFTGKEWEVAGKKGNLYYLCVISNVDGEINITIIQDPASKLRPKQSISTVIQVNWNVSAKQLNNAAADGL